jgi:hypothetical protein
MPLTLLAVRLRPKPEPDQNDQFLVPRQRQIRRKLLPETTRRPLVKQSIALRRIVVGLLALGGVGFILAVSLSSIADAHALADSPACPALTTGPRCHGELAQTVNNVAIDTEGRNAYVGVYLYGSTPELGWVSLGRGDAAFVRALRPGDTVMAEIWHGKAVALTARDETVGTNDGPAETELSLGLSLGGAGFLAFVLLRSASRTRMWNRLGFEPDDDGPEKRLMWIYGFTIGSIAAVGTGLLAVGVPWAAGLIVFSAVAVLYGLFAPWLLPRFRDLFLSYGPENHEAATALSLLAMASTEDRITIGYDTAYLHAGDDAAAVGRFLDAVAVLWPDMHVSVTDEPFEPWPRPLPATKTVVLVARDNAMVDGWDDGGYALDHTGEGPFAIWYGSEVVPVRVTLQENPFGPSEFGFDPYDAMVTGGFSMITIVTPDAESPFSNRIRGSLADVVMNR